MILSRQRTLAWGVVGLLLLAFLAPTALALRIENVQRRGAIGVVGSGSAQVVLQPDGSNPDLVRDARIMNWYPDDRFGGDGALQAQPPTGEIRALLRWDVSSLGSVQVQSAKLGLYAFYRSQDSGTWAFDIDAYGLVRE